MSNLAQSFVLSAGVACLIVGTLARFWLLGSWVSSHDSDNNQYAFSDEELDHGR